MEIPISERPLQQFDIVRGVNRCAAENFAHCPGFDESAIGNAWLIRYGISGDYTDDCMGLVLRSKRDAECAVAFLRSKGITPEDYNTIDDHESLIREIICNLRW